jgi:hypothetical protein
LGVTCFSFVALALVVPLWGAVDFNREVRPILSDNCFACHGPDEKQRMANLRLDTREDAMRVVVPGDSSKSRLFQRVHHADPQRRMPPPSFDRKLNDKQVELIRQWIDEGARWETHWAFRAPVRGELPAVKNVTWSKNPIDRFVLARLEREGLKPSPDADRGTLLRRLSFDLTGLPPSREEVAAFVADKSADAYEKQVDRLLGSTRYGERMAMQWMDLARYADSHGYHIDSHRDMWPWRDWLIRAYNSNMPFDRFTVLQLAGDLLPGAGNDEKIATGFNRNHMINFEGGAIPEEYLVEYVADRVDTTATTWMGLTMGCARCHSHKYDPISHKEFYQFFAFFNAVSEKGLDGREGNAKPFLKLPTPDQAALDKDLEARIKAADAALNSDDVKNAIEKWRSTLAGKAAPLKRDGLVAHYEMDGSFADSSGRYQHGRTLKGDPVFGAGRIARGVSFDAQTIVSLGDVGGFDRADPFTMAVWLNYGGSKQPMPVMQRIADRDSRRGFEIWYDEPVLVAIQRRAARLVFRLTAQWPADALVVRTRDRFTQGEWNHIALSHDGSARAAGLAVYVNGRPQQVEVVSDSLSGGIRNAAELRIGEKEPDAKAFAGAMDDLRFYSRVLPADEIAYIGVDYPARAILSGVGGKLTKAEEDRLRDYYLRQVAPAELRERHTELQALRTRAAKLEKEILTTMVMDEAEKPRDTFVLARGDYRNRTDKVTPGVPAVLPPLASGAKPDRLALANWLVDPQHPLTARVAVNRYWQMYFGTGLVKSAENFGSQGEPPSHPELLDWLATEFIAKKWDVKAMQRLIVTSAAYRQSSRVTPELLEKDPENRLLARGPRFRLPAETVRDNALAVSGLLNPAVGGSSVFPYQPPGIWEELAFGDGFSMQEYVQSHGPALYRRSMYTFWKRTAPPAQMLTFDAPDREKCVARRSVTNTPLQALVLLNDPTYIEAARALASRAMREGGKDAARRAAFIFEAATQRAPDKREIAVLARLAKQQMSTYARDDRAARELLKIGESVVDPGLKPAELAAWTAVASAVLNLDETITKE